MFNVKASLNHPTSKSLKSILPLLCHKHTLVANQYNY